MQGEKPLGETLVPDTWETFYSSEEVVIATGLNQTVQCKELRGKCSLFSITRRNTSVFITGSIAFSQSDTF